MHCFCIGRPRAVEQHLHTKNRACENQVQKEKEQDATVSHTADESSQRPENAIGQVLVSPSQDLIGTAPLIYAGSLNDAISLADLPIFEELEYEASRQYELIQISESGQSIVDQGELMAASAHRTPVRSLIRTLDTFGSPASPRTQMDSGPPSSPLVNRIHSIHESLSLLKQNSSGQPLHSRPNSSLIPTIESNVKLGAVIGQGSSGTVYLGSWKGDQVAVKRMIVRTGHDATKERMAAMEVAISQAMSHDNLVQTLSYSIKPLSDLSASSGDTVFRLELVQEYCDQGCLFDLVNERNGMRHRDGRLGYLSVLDVATDVARGILHLHSHNIIHNDLKADNVLLKSEESGQRVAKVVDFGMSFLMDPCQTHLTANHGTPSHMAPEALMDGKLSKSSDVYSFGILMAELTRGQVFKGLPLAVLTQLTVFSHQRPGFPDDVPVGFKDLAEKCWRPSPSSRPSFEVILENLMQLKASHQAGISKDSSTGLIARRVIDMINFPPVVAAFAEEDIGEIDSLGLPHILGEGGPPDRSSQSEILVIGHL